MDTLGGLILVPVALCVGGIALIGVVSALVLFVLSYKDERKRQFIAWQRLAAANHLTFRPGIAFNAGVVSGIYRGHSLKLEAVVKGSGSLSDIYTRIGVGTGQSGDEPMGRELEGVVTPPLITVDEVIALLTPAELRHNVWEELSVQAHGKSLWYEQHGFETNTDYLQFLFDWLCDLVETVPSIVVGGGELVPTLQELATRDSFLRPLLTQLLRDVAEETTQRLAGRASHLICANCLTRCETLKVPLSWWQSVTYYGCRTCGQSRKFINCPQGVIAVLDSVWPEPRGQHNGQVRVNWPQYRHIFDFDRVEVLHATDEDVERFAVQVGNDTDPVRQPHYRQMQCLVGPEARLSENTRRILERAFGKVESIKWNE